MNTQTLMEKYDLGKYVSPNVILFGDQVRHIDDLTSRISLGVEKLARTKLNEERANEVFPRIDVRFLEMSGDTKLKIENPAGVKKGHVDISVPRFAVYSLDNPFFRFYGRFYGSSIGMKYDSAQVLHTFDNLPDVFVLPLKKSIKFESTGDLSHYYDDQQYDYVAECGFIGLIPDTTKRIIQIEKERFKNLYLIAESENWTINSKITTIPTVSADPLLIGISGDNCYLLDQFNCTPLEYRMAKQMTLDPRKEAKK